MGRFDWLLIPLRAIIKIPRPVLLAIAYLLVASGSAFGIAIAVVEWRGESVDLAPIDQRLADLERGVSPIDGRLRAIEARAGTLSEDLEALRSNVQALAPKPAPLEPTPTPGPTPTARLTVNWIQRAVEFSPFGSNKRWVAVNVTIENISGDDLNIFYSGSQFTAKDGNDFVFPAVFPGGPFFCGAIQDGRQKILQPPLSGGSLGPGEKAQGDMAFDVPEGTMLTKLIWSAGLPGAPEIVVDLPPPQVSASEFCR